MKTFAKLNHYEVLKISAHADAGAVEHAYHEAMEIYGNDSLITYSLFSDEQRRELLQSIDEAYDTLIDNNKRSAYDKMLIDTGAMAPAPVPVSSVPPLRPADRKEPVMHRDLKSWVKIKAKEEATQTLIGEVLSKELISGHDLKRVREAYGIDLGEIYAVTRIAGSILRMIENDRFEELPADIYLRGFLKSYAEILQIEPIRIVEGYFRSKSSAAQPSGR